MADGISTLEHLRDPKTLKIYGWLDQIVSCVFPFSYVDNLIVQKYNILPPITHQSLVIFLNGLTKVVGEDFKDELLDKFGKFIDGWSDFGTSTPYNAIFADTQINKVMIW